MEISAKRLVPGALQVFLLLLQLILQCLCLLSEDELSEMRVNLD